MSNPLLDIANRYLEGKPVYYKLRRTFELLFVLSASSFLYSKWVGAFQLMDYQDYKAILLFFVNGEFILPLGIFASVYGSTWLLSAGIIQIYLASKGIRHKKGIANANVNPVEFIQGLNIFAYIGQLLTHHQLSPRILLQLYTENKASFITLVAEIDTEVEEKKDAVKEAFLSTIRAFVATTTFFCSALHFPTWIFVTIVIFLLGYMTVLGAAYYIVDIIPIALIKFTELADKYSGATLISPAEAAAKLGGAMSFIFISGNKALKNYKRGFTVSRNYQHGILSLVFSQ